MVAKSEKTYKKYFSHQPVLVRNGFLNRGPFAEVESTIKPLPLVRLIKSAVAPQLKPMPFQCWAIPGKHDTLKHCCFYVGPASKTLGQRQRRCANGKTTLFQCIEFAGFSPALATIHSTQSSESCWQHGHSSDRTASTIPWTNAALPIKALN